MIINYNPDDYEIEIKHHVCEYHRLHPGANWAGCTCFSSYSQRHKKPKERSVLGQVIDKYRVR